MQDLSGDDDNDDDVVVDDDDDDVDDDDDDDDDDVVDDDVVDDDVVDYDDDDDDDGDDNGVQYIIRSRIERILVSISAVRNAKKDFKTLHRIPCCHPTLRCVRRRR